jgi:vacuolar protein sorting-associated protein 13A/C
MRGTIAKVLNKVLGDFIEGINADDFHFSMTKGRVELSNLRLKKDFFHTLNLPLELVASYVGSLTLDIPFQSLKTKPIVVELSQVYATLAPSADLDPKIMRRSNLEAHDRAWAEAKEEADDDKEDSQGMAAKYLQKIMDNIQITIQDSMCDMKTPSRRSAAHGRGTCPVLSPPVLRLIVSSLGPSLST